MSVFSDQLDLNVLLHSLEQYPNRLPPDLLEKLQILVQSLQQKDSQAATDLVLLFQQNPILEQLYEQSLQDLRNGYITQERAKCIPLVINQPWSQQSTEFSDTIQRIAYSLQNLHTYYQETALSQIKQTILKSLEKTPMRSRDLFHTIGQSTEQIQPALQKLWEDGFIDVLSSSPLYTIFPGLRKGNYRHRSVPSDTFLTLTSKGYFYLYPMFKRKEATTH
jgi:hypothetical protein